MDAIEGTSYGFVECGTTRHKTANTAKKRRKLLPMAGLAFGVPGMPWARKWIELRKERGLVASESLCLMPAPMPAGGFSRRMLSTCDGTLWLRELLKKVCEGVPCEGVSTHSLKAATLSWAAKGGLKAVSQRLLGTMPRSRTSR